LIAVYEVRGPLPTADGRPPLLMIGQPMQAGGFATLAGFFPDRTVVTYDRRGLGRSNRKDGRTTIPSFRPATSTPWSRRWARDRSSCSAAVAGR
jgi:hypothetical protein